MTNIKPYQISELTQEWASIHHLTNTKARDGSIAIENYMYVLTLSWITAMLNNIKL
jgi:hypothetical protein